VGAFVQEEHLHLAATKHLQDVHRWPHYLDIIAGEGQGALCGLIDSNANYMSRTTDPKETHALRNACKVSRG
jgi:hypothetical protein